MLDFYRYANGNALVSTSISRSDYSDRVSLYNSPTNQRLEALTSAFQNRGMDADTAHQQAL